MRETKYELIALDMDGTLLDSGQRITLRAKAAVGEILAHGKQVVFATGRCRPQLEEYLECFPQMRYLMKLLVSHADFPAEKISIPKGVEA